MKTMITTSFILCSMYLTGGFSFAQEENNQSLTHNQKTMNMSTIEKQKKNKETIRYLYEDILNSRKFELLEEIVSETFTGPQGTKGSEGFQQRIMLLLKTLPDAQWNIHELIAENNKVVVKWTLQGTNKGPFQHFPPTGQTVENTGVGFYELENGKIINALVQTDRLGFLQDIQVVPADLSSLTGRKAQKDQVCLIDRFIVPEEAKQEFLERANISRNIVKTLPGFVKEGVYHRTDEHGNLIFITVVVWENQEAFTNAKEAVQTEYQKQHFNPAEMMDRLNIQQERGVYKQEAP